jgi:hypothetical protein
MAKARKPKNKTRNRANFAKRMEQIKKNFEVLKLIKKEELPKILENAYGPEPLAKNFTLKKNRFTDPKAFELCPNVPGLILPWTLSYHKFDF